MEYASAFSSDANEYLDDFSKQVIWNITIHKVNIPKATFKEALAFKELLLSDISPDNLKIIIDLSLCEHIDSSFLGTLVIALKKISGLGGEIKFVIPNPSAITLLRSTGLIDVLNLYQSRDEAIDSFVYVPLELLK
jgi:anti-anti-sigma factor